MNRQELLNIVQSIVEDAGQQAGVTAVAVGGNVSSGLAITVRLSEVDTVEFNRDKSIDILVYKGQSKGSVSITDLAPEAIRTAITAACKIADFTEADPYAGLADKELLAKKIIDLDLDHPAAITTEQAISYAKECEAAAFAFDPRVNNSDGASFNTSEGYHIYANSNGFCGAYPTTSYTASCVVIAEQSGQMQRNYDYTVARDLNDLQSMKEIGISAAQKTVASLGARKVRTCTTPVIFIPKIAKGLWNALVSAISGGSLYRNRSFLLDHLGRQIFPEFVNIYERPHILKALGSAPFDAEGVLTTEKSVISKGILDTYFLSSYSARKLNMRSTGNAGGVHNLCVGTSGQSYAELIKTMNQGLVVTELMGQGTNIVTGDYSQGAAGFWVENGEIAYPVQEITIAGNFKDMFKGILAVGNDLDSRSGIITGSVLIDKMTLAGN